MRLAFALLALAGCASRCPELAAARRALADRPRDARGPHAQVRIPFARANAFVAELLLDQPLVVPIELPALAALALPTRQLTAVAREVRLRPASTDRLGFAIQVELADAALPITSLALDVEVEPKLVRERGATELVIGFGPDNLVAIRPRLDASAERALADAIERWLPLELGRRIPRVVLETAARELATHLTGAAYDVLRQTLLRRLGELTRVRLRLPDLPIAATTLTSSADALVVDVVADLPVRRGLAAIAPAGDEVGVRISGSTAAELANWAIDRAHLPQHYTRGLEPKPDGAFRPWFDYRTDDPARPLKVHVLQERGGCSHFVVGMRAQLRIVADKLEVAILDRYVEHASASPLVEVGLWLKQLVEGSVDRSRRAAAHTQLTIGGRTLTTRATRADIVDGELRFELRFVSSPK